MRVAKGFESSLIEWIKTRYLVAIKEAQALYDNNLSTIKILQNIKAVLFDVYGTLLIPTTPIFTTHSLSALFKDVGLPPLLCEISLPQIASKIENQIQKYHNISKRKGILYPEVNIISIWQNILTDLQQQNLLKQKAINKITLYKLILLYELYANPHKPVHRISSLIRKLKNSHIVIGFVSNAQFYTPLFLKVFPETRELIDMADERLCLWSYKYGEAKPSPLLFEKAAAPLEKVFNIARKDVLFIGDSDECDRIPAIKCGFNFQSVGK